MTAIVDTLHIPIFSENFSSSTLTCEGTLDIYFYIEMKGIFHLCCVFVTFPFSKGIDLSQYNDVVSLDSSSIHKSSDIRDLGVGELKTMKKPKVNSSKEKLPKNDAMGSRGKKVGKGKGKGSDYNNDDENNIKGKGMAKMKGMMGKGKGKSKSPIDVETTTPTTTPSAVSSSPVPTTTPITTVPFGGETASPILTSVPSPVALETETPSVTQAPTAMTTAPIVMSPSAQPILVSPTNFAFIGTSNILVRYESLNIDDNVNLNQTMAAIELTCDYMRNEAIVPLGALEFACIWFLPDFNENDLTGFPVEITYAGTAAFPSDMTNITTEVLDASLISALTPPTVENLTEMINTDLPSENPFSQTVEIYAVV